MKNLKIDYKTWDRGHWKNIVINQSINLFESHETKITINDENEKSVNRTQRLQKAALIGADLLEVFKMVPIEPYH